MMSKLVISQSPHLHTKPDVKKLMYAVIIALLPSLALSLFFYGVGALVVTAVAVVAAVVFEWLIVKFILKKEPTIWDGSAIITGLLLAFNVPSNLPIWIIIVGALVAIGVGKLSFGGLGQNPFNPALVGRVFLLISFPVQMTSWPTPLVNRGVYIDAITGATPLGVMKEGLKNGEAMSSIMQNIPSHLQMFYGQMGGSLGEISALLLILGGIYLLFKKVISWHIPGSIFITVILISGIFWLMNPEANADPLFHLLTGGIMLGAIYMATDYSTSPMSNSGKIVFGVGIGVLTMVIRLWGAYPEGVSFAILIMNAFVPIINKGFKPKLFGAKK
ncbi:MAG: RnfABCDGE type electron transport complex subunit D [Paludibacteraceae bacterium]|nr:RnfABCDGE type electron transport complex subunit D [Paludibacteraceae bacterium]